MKRNVKLLILLSVFMGSGIFGGTSLAVDTVAENGDAVHYFSVKSKAGLGNYDNHGAEGAGSIAIGTDVSVKVAADGGVVLGHDTSLDNGVNDNHNNSIVVGNYMTVEGTQNAVFGMKYHDGRTKLTKVFGEQNTVIGLGNLVGWTATRDSEDSTQWKYDKSPQGSNQAVVVGLTNTGGGNSILFGSSNEAIGLGIAIGAANTVKGYQAMVFGRDSQALKDQDLAVGFETEATGGESTAVGFRTKAKGRDAASFGSYAEATGRFASALGYHSLAAVEHGVALGSLSSADVGKGVSGYLAAEKTDDQHDSVWTSTLGAVSIGSAEHHYTRQITNVAAGLQDTDAVNVAQLKAVSKKMEASGVHYFSVNSQPDLKNYNNDGAGPEGSIAIGPNVNVGPNATGAVLLGHDTEILHPKVGEDTYNNNANHSIVVGNHLTVEGISNAVFGTKYHNYDTKETKVFGDNNTVIGLGNLVGWKATKNSDDQTKWDYVKSDSGSDQAVVVGMNNTGEGGSVLLGSSNEARDLGIAIGAGNTVKGNQAMVFGRDSQAVKDQDLAVGFETEASGEESVAVGYQAKATGRNAAGFGAHAEVSTEGAIGFGSYAVATGDSASALGYASNATANYGVALGAWSSADVGNDVSGYLAAEKTDDQHNSVWTSTLGPFP